MDQFTIVLPNERARTYKNVTLILLLMNALAFSMILFSTASGRLQNFCIFGLSVSLVALLLYLLNAYTRYLSTHRPEVFIILISLTWLLVGKFFVGSIILCFAIIGFYTRKNFDVIFMNDKIIYPSFPRKIFLWKDVNNVVLKDNLLTIDLKNNRLIQSLISKESQTEIDEEIFNEFCRKHLGS
jgi:hypothetical protein